MEIYFDNAATSKVSKEVLEIMNKVYIEDYGNPSSLHRKGIIAENYIRETDDILCNILNVSPTEIIYTSGGTESNNMAILGTAFAYKRSGKHIIASNIEHASVYNTLNYLEELGYEITILDVNEEGLIDIDLLKGSVRKDTILVSIMHVNNEIGTIQDIEGIGNAIKEKNNNTIFHVDAIQSFGKLNININKSNIDLLSVSAHKFHGPKGVGFLYYKKGNKIKPLIYGGGQQRDMRSGTENVPAIAGLGVAASIAYKELDNNYNQVYNIKMSLYNELCKNIKDVYSVNRDFENTSPYILSVIIRDIRSEVLLHSLEDYDIYVSTGSACSSNKKSLVSTIKAINVDNRDLDSNIRFSFSKYNNIEQTKLCVKSLSSIVPILRKFRQGANK